MYLIANNAPLLFSVSADQALGALCRLRFWEGFLGPAMSFRVQTDRAFDFALDARSQVPHAVIGYRTLFVQRFLGDFAKDRLGHFHFDLDVIL